MKLCEVANVNYDEYFKSVMTDCKQYLNSIDNSPTKYNLLRGIEGKHIFTKLNVRKNRQPRDMPKDIHKLIDDWFLENFGHRYRSNALFATSNFTEIKSADYGTPHRIFPIGDFNFVWSPAATDLWTATEKDMSDFVIKQGDDIHKDPELLKDFVDNMMKNLNYQSTDIKKAIKSRNEIMIACDSYYATTISGFNKELERKLKK